MTVIKRIYIVLFLAMGVLRAQDTLEIKTLKPMQLKRLGKAAMDQGDYYSASEYFKQFFKLKNSNGKIAYRLATCYRINRDYTNAQEWYDKAYKQSANPLALYYYALMLKTNGDCEKAKLEFGRFRKEAGHDAESARLKKQMKNDLLGCDSAIAFTRQISMVTVTHLDTTINKIHVEHSPLMLDTNVLLYSSVRTDKKVYNIQSDSVTSVGAYKKFYTARKENGKWSFSGEYDNPINKDGSNNTNAALSADGKRMYFTRCKPNTKNKMICTIYLTKKDSAGNWTEPEPLGKEINNPKYTSTQPATSIESVKQNEVVYFVSDRPGGKGGLDIWYFIYDFKKKIYSAPKNAGSKVNTPSDEITPFYEGDTRTLYFSSNGWPGLGGLDVFKGTGEMKRFSQPENIGAPINSSSDDLYYTSGKNKDDGFFVSNRKGGVTEKKNPTCCDDIYAYKKLHYIKLNVQGVVTDEKGQPVAGTKVSLYSTKEGEEPVFIKSAETDKDGKYDISVEAANDYKLVFEKEKYLNSSDKLSTKGITASQSIPHNSSIKEIPDKPIVLTNVHYATDRYELTADSKKDLDTTLLVFLKENPDVIIEISSHTDNQASDSYNNTLSQKRAEGVVKYLVSQGIGVERLQAHGYGETRPVADNNTAEGRAANRRTEFKILGKLPPKEKEYDEKD